MKCGPKRLLMRYKDRWGAEITYRGHNTFLPKTKSKNYAVRVLYYAVAVCVYNAWFILNSVEDGNEGDSDSGCTQEIVLEVKLFILLEFLISAPT